MKICIVTPIFPLEVGGPATYTYDVAKLLHARGHEVKIVTFSREAKPKKLKGVTVFSVKTMFSTLLRQRNMFSTILKVARDSDLIYAQDAAVVGPASVWAAKLLRKPIIIKFVGDIAWEKASLDGKTSKFLDDFLKSPEGGPHIEMLINVQRFVFRSVNRVIVPSNYLKGLLVKYYGVPPGKVRVIYNAVDLDFYKKLKPGGGKEPTVISIGRLVPWKGLDEVIKTVPSLIKKYPTFKLLVVGDGPEKERLKRLAVQLKIGTHVQFLGKVKRDRAMELLKDSDVLILNSRYEGLPHVVIEAMACKTPVIATKIGGTKEIIEHNKTGMLIKIGDVKALKKNIDIILKNKKTREKLVNNAYKLLLEKFTWEKTLEELEHLFKETFEIRKK